MQCGLWQAQGAEDESRAAAQAGGVLCLLIQRLAQNSGINADHAWIEATAVEQASESPRKP